MQCPNCGYMMTPFESACPRCTHFATKQTPQLQSAPIVPPPVRNSNGVLTKVGIVFAFSVVAVLAYATYKPKEQQEQKPVSSTRSNRVRVTLPRAQARKQNFVPSTSLQRLPVQPSQTTSPPPVTNPTQSRYAEVDKIAADYRDALYNIEQSINEENRRKKNTQICWDLMNMSLTNRKKFREYEVMQHDDFKQEMEATHNKIQWLHYGVQIYNVLITHPDFEPRYEQTSFLFTGGELPDKLRDSGIERMRHIQRRN